MKRAWIILWLGIKVFGGKGRLLNGPGYDGLNLLFLEHRVNFGYEIADTSSFFEPFMVFL